MAANKKRKPIKRPSEVDQIVGKNLRRIRREKGMTQTQLSDELELTFQQIQKYERGVNRIAVGRLPGFARALKCDVDDFFEGIETRFDGVTPAERKLEKKLIKLKDGRRKLIRQIELVESVDLLNALSMMLNTLESDATTVKKNCA